jgi:hypothetical protein
MAFDTTRVPSSALMQLGFFDNTTHAKSITDWFNFGGSLTDVAKGGAGQYRK